MKNKIIKASLFSALTLSALIFVGGGLRNNDVVKCNNVSEIIAPATPKVSSSNIDWPTTGGTVDLTEDTELTSTWTITEGTTDLNLNGHVLSVSNDAQITTSGAAILNINDSGSVTHNYYADSTKHYWVLDQSGEKTITGGVIYNSKHSTLHSTFNVIDNSQLVINGGTICGATRAIDSVASNATITMNGGSISGNAVASGTNGPAIRLNCKTFTLNDGVISENYVTNGYGGAIYIESKSSTAIIKGGLITKNVALNNGARGGGAFASRGTLIIDGGEISYNQAISTDNYSSYGGAAFLYINSTTIVNGGLITHNSSIAENGGTAFGAAFTATDTATSGASTLTINGGEFSYNESISNTGNARGGAIYCHAKTDLIINGGLITHNVAKVTSATATGIAYGGGIYANKYHIHGGEISYNEAQNCGAIYSNTYSEATPNCFEVPEGSELIIKNNTASVDNGAGNIDSNIFNISGKIIIADNKVSTSNDVTNDNLLITRPVTVTGSLEGSDIHYVYVYNATGESEVVAYDYTEKTGSTRVNEFFHYEGDNHYYQDISDDGDIIVNQISGGGTTHPIEPPAPSEGGNVYADFDDAYPGKEVTVTVEQTECHKLSSLIVSYGSTQEDITETKTFTMPNADVKIIATFVEHHELVLIKGKEPTATEAGWKDYYQCNECKKYYEDKEGTKEIADLEAWKIGEGKIDPIGPGPAPEPSDNASTSTLAIVAFTVGGVSLLALLIIIIILLAKKKKKDEEKITNVRCDKKDSIAPKLNEYVFSFKYKGNEVKYFMFLTKTNRVSKDDVLKMFDRLKQNGEIIKYAKRFDKERERKKKILIPLFILLGVISIAGASYGTYCVINNGGANKPVEAQAEITQQLVEEGVTLSNPTVKIGEKYETKITVDTTKSEGKLLPDKLNKVTCGNKDLDPLPPKNEYTYTLGADSKQADLVIPAEFVTGNITINFSLVTPGPTPVISDYTEIKYHYSGEEAETEDHNVGFTFDTTDNDVTVDWGDGTPVAVTTSPAISPTLGDDATIKVYGDADNINFAYDYVAGNQYITSIVYSKHVTIIPDQSFTYAINLTNLSFSEGVKKIGSMAFVAPILEAVSIPSTVTKIGEKPFYVCRSLNTITVAPNNTKYSSEGSNLIDINNKTLMTGTNNSSIPSGVETIAEEAFYALNNMKDVVIPNTVTSIGIAAFYNTHINSLTFEAGTRLKTIPNNMLSDTVIVEPFSLPEGIQRIIGWSLNDSEIKYTDEKLVLPSTLEYLEESAFRRASGFNTLVLNAGLKEIGTGSGSPPDPGACFESTDIVTVDATALTTTSYPTILGDDNFPTENKDFKIVVASEAVKNALVNDSGSGWAQYANYIKY